MGRSNTIHVLGLALVVGVFGACDRWSYENECDPICPPMSTCRCGTCIPHDAGPPDLGPPQTVDGGQKIWAIAIGNTKAEKANEVACDEKTGDLAAVGSTILNSEDGFVVLTDAQGNTPWMKIYGGGHYDRVHGAAFGAGLLHVAGQFNGTAGFDGLSVKSSGYDDLFLMALDHTTGDRKHFRRFGREGYETPRRLLVDPNNGDLLMAGSFKSSKGAGVDFGGDPLYSKGGNDIFLAAYRSDGAHLWSRSWGSLGEDFTDDLHLAADGSILLTGRFSGPLDFGDKVQHAHAGGTDIYLMKCDRAGRFKWGVTIGSVKNDAGQGVTTDAAGNVYLAATFQAAMPLGNVVHHGDHDGLVASFDKQGNHRWSWSFGAKGVDGAMAIRTNSQGFPILGGYFSGEVSIGGKKLKSEDKGDGFVAQLEPSGRLRWIRQLRGPGDDRVTALALTPEDDVAVLGTFEQSLTPGPDKNSGGVDAFLMKLSR